MVRFDRNSKITRCIGDAIKGYMGSFKESKVMVSLNLQENQAHMLGLRPES